MVNQSDNIWDNILRTCDELFPDIDDITLIHSTGAVKSRFPFTWKCNCCYLRRILKVGLLYQPVGDYHSRASNRCCHFLLSDTTEGKCHQSGLSFVHLSFLWNLQIILVLPQFYCVISIIPLVCVTVSESKIWWEGQTVYVYGRETLVGLQLTPRESAATKLTK